MKKENSNKVKSITHDEDHAQWNRRGFLKTLGVAGGGMISFGSSALSVVDSSFLNTALSDANSDRILVLIRLKGGNDGLNTIVPLYDFDLYANKRPNIYIPENKLIKLNDDFAIPNYMSSIEDLWKNGSMKAVHGVGYGDQNLSHFKSSEIWATTTKDSNTTSGWLGRYYEDKHIDYLTNPPKNPLAIQVGSGGDIIFNGDLTTYSFSVSSPQRLKKVAENGTLFDTKKTINNTHGDQVSFLREASNTTFRYASVINDAYNNSNQFDSYQDNNFDLQLSLVSRFIKGGLGTKVYMVTLGGFDTHANQSDRHEVLMSTLSNALKTFYDDLKKYGIADKVLSMTFSEFGRRVSENGSGGTDHGSAAPIMFFGPSLNGSSLIGNHPNLNFLDTGGNMESTMDFKSIYATVLTDWLCADPDLVNRSLLGSEYNLINLGFSCNGIENLELTGDPILSMHAAVIDNKGTSLYLNVNEPVQLEVVIFDISGKKVGTAFKNQLSSGPHNFPLRSNEYNSLPTGHYFYKIIVNGNRTFSRAFMVK
tara:strand:+ start:10050 stop:11657 length:1608 start_codon:yes stop_codon:yes gene_type:complete